MIIGLDIGSRAIKAVGWQDGQLLELGVKESGFDPREQSRQLLERFQAIRVVATGYGRNLAKTHFASDAITEIKAHALGARYYFPDCRTVLDVGGQDAKVISLAPNGKVTNFQMNDRCAAGTGRFLEIMAASMGFALPEFGAAALEGSDHIRINSMCTVFAESEVVSLKNQGHALRDIARAVHQSVVDRLAAMLHRANNHDKLVFTGGVANNLGIVRLLEQKLGVSLRRPTHPDITGAVGAALHGAEISR